MTEQSKDLVIVQKPGQIREVYSSAELTLRAGRFKQFVSGQMIKGTDYGVIPGTSKPTLLQPGAEKILAFYGLQPRPVLEEKIERWDLDNPLFYYLVRYEVWRNGELIGWAHGSANSRESRYAYRWVAEHQLPPMGEDEFNRLHKRGGKTSEFDFAVEKAETTGQYAKPQAYWDAFQLAIDEGTALSIIKKTRKGVEYKAWEIDMTMYRVPNPDIFDQVNTLLKISEKRGMVACALVIGLAHEFFTQDLEDIGPQGGGYEEGTFTSIEETYDADLTKEPGPPLMTDQQFAIIGDLLVEAGTLTEATPQAVAYVLRRRGFEPDMLAQTAAETIIETMRTTITAQGKAPEEVQEQEEEPEQSEPSEAPAQPLTHRQQEILKEHWAASAGQMFLDWAKLEHDCSEDQVLAYLNQAEGIKIEKLTDTGFTLEMAQRAIQTAAAKEQASEDEPPEIVF